MPKEETHQGHPRCLDTGRCTQRRTHVGSAGRRKDWCLLQCCRASTSGEVCQSGMSILLFPSHSPLKITPAKPILVGNTNNENAASTPINSVQARIQNCPSHAAANLRRQTNVKVWRYLFAGEFPNHTLGPCCPNAQGAWHGAELGLIFGTVESRGQGKDTKNGKQLAKILRDAWSTFAKDPVNGLEKMGWPVYNPESESLSHGAEGVTKGLANILLIEATVVILGGKDSAEVKFQSPQQVDPRCSSLGFQRSVSADQGFIDLSNSTYSS
jgi:hypothetical protein